jgi:phosphoglycerate dehydrogenase-like enzyme
LLNLAIISRDHLAYQALFEQHRERLTHINLIFCGKQASDSELKAANIILSEPDLAAQFIEHCTSLQWLQSTWAGNNKLQEHPKRDYLLSGVKGIFAQQMREYVMAYLLYFERKIADFQQLQEAHKWQSQPIGTLYGKTLGIMGLGNIGLEVANTAQHFGMQINAITRSSKQLLNANYFSLSQLSEFVKECDYIVNLLPQTQQTKGLCSPVFFKAMKKTAVFINAGRGSIVDSEHTLVEALQQKEIAGAVLDVFLQEPLAATSRLYQAPNCYITNHTAAVSQSERVFEVFINNLERFTHQQSLMYVHNFECGY